MASEEQGFGYRIWAVDNVVYGPVELPTLVAWVKDERVTPGTWVFVEEDQHWHQAAAVPELRMFFQRPAEAAAGPSSAARAAGAPGIKPGALRRVKILAGFNDAQLLRLVEVLEVQQIPQWSTVVKQGDHGDAMFLVLSGELRARLMISGKESILATLGPGDFFGEISLFDHGPRSADVVANADSTLLKVSAPAFEQLMKDAPDIAASLLLATAKTLTGRIRADNKRYQDSIYFARAAR